MESPYEADVKACIEVMKNDGIILYPTDTIWGLGCSALNEKAMGKIFDIKKRSPHKSFVLLMTDVKQLSKYIANPIPPGVPAGKVYSANYGYLRRCHSFAGCRHCKRW